MAGAFPNAPDISDELITLFERMFADIPPALLEIAVMQHIAEKQFFPVVAELRNMALDLGNRVMSTAPTAAEAWREVTEKVASIGSYGQPEFSHVLVQNAVACIGWQNICQSETPGVERAHFLRIFEQLVERAARDARMLPQSKRVRELLTGISAGELPPDGYQGFRSLKLVASEGDGSASS